MVPVTDYRWGEEIMIIDGSLLEQLQNLTMLTWDGDLISKDHRKTLVRRGYAAQCQGWNIITPKGIKLLDGMGKLKP